MDDAALDAPWLREEDTGTWEATPRQPCTHHEECSNPARPGGTLCYACDKRRQRGSRTRYARHRTAWGRLSAAALRYAEAEEEAEYAAAEAALRRAAMRYSNRKRRGTAHAAQQLALL